MVTYGYIKIGDAQTPLTPAIFPQGIYGMVNDELVGKTFEVYSNAGKYFIKPCDAQDSYPTLQANVVSANMHNIELAIGDLSLRFWRPDGKRPLSLTSTSGLVKKAFGEFKQKAA